MATAFAHDTPTTTPPLARAAGKLALVASAGAEAIAAGLGQPSFAEAHAEVQRLIHAENNLPPGHTDEDVDAACDRSSAAVKVLLAIPSANTDEAFAKVDVVRALYEAHAVPYLAETLDELRERIAASQTLQSADLDVEFFAMVAKIGAMPDAKQQFDAMARAWKRAGIVEDLSSTDATLVEAWQEWKAGANDVDRHGGGDTALGEIAAARHEAAEDIIVRTIPTGATGVAIKLRCALYGIATEKWVSQAIQDGDDTTLIARAEDMDAEAHAIVDAIAFLTRPAPSQRAWEAAVAGLINAEAASDKHWTEVEEPLSAERGRLFPQQLDSPECVAWCAANGWETMMLGSDRSQQETIKAEDRLFETPAPDAAALALKLDRLFNNNRDPIPGFQALVQADAHRLAGTAVPQPAPSPVRQAFEAWIAARITYDLADSGLEPDEDPTYMGWIEAERTLAATPPRSAEDMLFKLFPLALSEHGPTSYQGTFELVYQPAGPVDAPYLDDSTWRGLIDGMMALSPRLAIRCATG